MPKTDYNWNTDSDEKIIADANAEIENLSQRLDIQEQRLADEESDEQESDEELLWPSLLPKDD